MLPIIPRLACYLNTFLAWVSNGLLIFLIIRKSPRSMANYKYLMLIFAIFGLFFGVIDITNQAFLHFYQGCYIIFSENLLGLPRMLSFWYIALNCACYEMTLYLLAFHFIYRYLAVCKPHLLYLFSWPYFNIFTGVFVFFTLTWCTLGISMAGESERTEKYIETTMLQTYGLKRGDYTYAVTVFYKTDPKTNLEHLSLLDLAFVAAIGAIIIFGFSIIMFCWLNLRHRLILSARRNQSQRTLIMQRQLFSCLVSQTLLPFIFMFIPAFILLVFPLFKLEIGPSEGFILSLITTQPFIDAIVPMYFITEYRRAILRFFGRKSQNPRVLHVSMSTASGIRI